jgi:hypothetical protein
MKNEDIKFCQEHIINFQSVAMGFTRNIDFRVLGEYERMYKEYLDPQFSLTYWCGECVFDMLKRLSKYYESQINTLQTKEENQVISLQEQKEILVEIIKKDEELGLYEVKKKKGRPKKNG